MKELSQQELSLVSGAGFIEDALSNIGGVIGKSLYGLVSDSTSVSIPLLGNVSISSLLPNLGTSIGSSLGSKIGSAIENTLASIPLIGSWLNSLLGN
ncbi:hypothetical protein [Erwinia mallotivora]|uniref:Uncharacterized protein n=1 Tax=Erwinia mallotivora TaxID=69222 RepID=A0A014M114_9GAMM|nr:hypothetical protein [Erwinia mallotivora]EXU75531.1 hypothetical protein BG55_10165 [Erwinia mallotivora]